MVDTGFYVPANKLSRFTTFYAVDAETAELRVLDSAGWLVVEASEDGRRGGRGGWCRPWTTC